MNKRLPKLVGYAAIWNEIAQDPENGGFYDRMASLAFGRATVFNDVKALWQHNWDYVLASNDDRRGGGVNLWEDTRGLAFEIEPYEDREWIDQAISLIRSGKVRGMSCSFDYSPTECRFERLASGMVVRTIARARLDEISVVCSGLCKEPSVRLVDPPATKAQPAEPAASPATYRDVIRIDPAQVSSPRRHTVRAGLAVYC
jgi:HK97 family phage prohead protease